MTEPHNLSIWNAVEATDPKFTKGFSRGGGFRGTATNATWLAKRATETFGPCGMGWGVKVLDERILEGAPLGEGVRSQVHRVHIQLWYVLDGKRGEVEHFGQTEFVGKNKNGYFTDEEAPKKSLTDAMSKALSLLGFAADVHLGLFDDNKYVAEVREHYDAAPARLSSNSIKKNDPDFWPTLEREVRACNTLEDLRAVFKTYRDRVEALPIAWAEQWDDLITTQRDAIQAKVAA